MNDSDSSLIERFQVPSSELDTFGHIPDSARPKESLRVVRLHALPGVETWDTCSSGRLWTVFHTAYHFCAAWHSLQPGQQLWRYRGEVHSMTHGSTMLLEPGELHATLRSPPSRFVVVGLDPAFVASHVEALLGKKSLHFRKGQIDDVRVESRLKAAAIACLAGAEPLCVEERLLEFLHAALERDGESQPTKGVLKHPDAVRRALELIHDEYGSRLTLTEIADAAALSKYHLHRTFRATVGQPIHQYVLNVRLGQAMCRLRAGQPLKVVANETGFADQAHLTRAFRKHIGITPGSYRAGGVAFPRLSRPADT
jgi:AraC-like DNA-binding protein